MKFSKLFLFFFFYTLAVLSLSGTGNFFENGFYLEQARSIIQDFDFNIINQVENPFNWHLTETFYHPSQHTEIMTPAAVLAILLENFVSLFSPATRIETYLLSGAILNFCCFYMILILLRRVLSLYELRLKRSTFFFIILGSSILYYSFFYVYIIDIFVMVLTTFLLLSFARYLKSKSVDGFSVSLCASLCLVSKITFLPFFILAHYFILRDFYRSENRNTRALLVSLIPTFLICGFSAYKNILQYGEFILVGRYLSYFLSHDPMVAFYTIIYGFFPEGGFYYNNIPFFLGTIGIIFFVKDQWRDLNIESRLVYLFYVVWVVFSQFQMLFVPMEYINEQYVGRGAFVAFPQYALGLFWLTRRLKRPKLWNLIVLIGVAFQLFNSLAYRGIRVDYHYVALVKTPLGDILYQIKLLLIRMINNLETIFLNDFIPVFLFFGVAGVILYLASKVELNVKKVATWYLLLFSVFHLLNAFNGKRNGKAYVDRVGIESRVISSNPYMVYFSFYLDAFRYCELKTKFPFMKDHIKEKRRRLYDLVKPGLVSSTPLFDLVLEEKDYNFGYYCEPSYRSNCMRLINQLND